MKLSRNCLLALSALASVAVWTLGWAVALIWFHDAALPVRAGVVAAGIGLAATAAGLGRRWLQGERQAVARHFDALCRLSSDDLNFDDGSRIPPLASCAWRSAATQVRERIVELGREIEELRHAQTAVEIRSRRANAQHDLIKSILAGVTEPIVAVNEFDELMLANRAAEQLFSFEAEGTEERAAATLLHCEKLVDLLTSTSHRKSSSCRSDEIEIVDGDGQSRWYRATASKLPRLEAGGESVGGAVAVLRDIGEQKVMQKRNAEFVSSVSHEMKTPLAGIKAYVELLADGEAEDEETREEFLSVINGQADRLQRLVDNLLNLARIEAGVVQVNKQNRSLNEVLEEAIGVVQPSAEAKNITLSGELSPLYLGVHADRDMLLQSAINLLSNAIKYTPQGGRVVLRSRLEDDEVSFEVEDSGVGLSEEDCQRVFEKFYRVAKDKNMAAGTGLGLPLAKHIVEDVHSGRLAVRSTLGAGSTFVVSLPQAGQMAG